MIRFKRSIGILLSVLMIAGLFAALPVSVNAADGDKTTVKVEKWIKGDKLSNTLYRYKDLYANVIFFRVNPNPAEGDEFNNNPDSPAVWNRTGELTLDNNTCYIYGWNDGMGWSHLQISWGDGGRSGDGYIYIELQNEIPNTEADWYAYTWEDFELTEHAANTLTSGSKSNVECYTSGTEGDYRYYLKDSEDYTQVSESEVFFDYVTSSGEGINRDSTITKAADDSGSFGGFVEGLELRNMLILGVQEHIRIEDEDSSIRFVSVINSDIVNDADEYGFVVAKTSSSKATALANCDKFDYNSTGKVTVFDCKGTSNKLCGNYGDYYASTTYKYVSLAVKGVSDLSETLAVRFYVKKGAKIVYSKYIQSGNEYDGIAASLADYS